MWLPLVSGHRLLFPWYSDLSIDTATKPFPVNQQSTILCRADDDPVAEAPIAL